MNRAANGVRRVPQLTGRDFEALRWVGEQYAARADVLAVLLARLSPAEVPSGFVTERVVRRVLERWERAGLVRPLSMLGRRWAVPTSRGLAFADLFGPERPGSEPKPWEEWQPSGPRLGHVHAAAIVRLWAEAQSGTWRAERWLRRDREDARRRHLFDGTVTSAAGLTLGVEVELHQKPDRDLGRILRLMAKETERVPGVFYFTPAELVERIGRQLDRVGEQLGPEVRLPELTVRQLPDVVGVSYAGRW